MGPLVKSANIAVALLLITSLPFIVSGAHKINPDHPLNQNKPGPYKVYKTEPLFIPSIIKVTRRTEDSSLLAPGYHFIAPHIGSNGFGPQIVDHDGELVWYGLPSLVKVPGTNPYGMDLSACDFQGSLGNHLCWSEGRPKDLEDQGVKAGGANRIFNNRYEPVAADYVDFGGMATPNPHEFNMLEGGDSFIQSVYQPRKRDLRPYGGTRNGWVLDGCFQEIDVRFRRVVFKWCFLDHYDVWETFLYLNIAANTVNSSSGTSGKGTAQSNWDFMHLNAIDKNEEGDYLVSGRHLSQLLKIAGPKSQSGKRPGETIWRLNGRHSDFEMEKEAIFGRQHHCRFVSTGQNETVVSMFNNAFDGATGATRKQSAGLVLRLNNDTMTAKVEHMFDNPYGKLSFAQGATQKLPNGNWHVGWGTYPQYSEFSDNGTLLYHAKVFSDKPKSGKLTNYRSFKHPWVGNPKTKPKLVAYCQTCNTFAALPSKRKGLSPLIAYVSWNGATEVKTWRFFLKAQKNNGPWIPAGEFPRKGFETKVRLESKAFEAIASFATWVSVEALDADGNVLESAFRRTFVPNFKIKNKCGKFDCHDIFRFDYPLSQSRAKSCGVEASWLILLIVSAVLLVGLESLDKLYLSFMHSYVYGNSDVRSRTAFLPVSQGQFADNSPEKVL